MTANIPLRMTLNPVIIISSTVLVYCSVIAEPETHCLWPSHSYPCQYCVIGWFGEDCSKNCSNCDTAGCEKDTGRCLVCKDGFYSNSCALRCPEHCKGSNSGKVRCDRDTGNCLDKCEQGWWGDKCNKRCNENCKDSTCLFYDGSCVWGCKDGWTGDMCTQNCPNECKGNKCTLYGKCMEGCNVGFYGEKCESRCSDNCRNNDCYFDSVVHGKVCRAGCRDRWMSSYCNKMCPAGCERCNQHSGKCSACKMNYWGSKCDKLCNSTCINSYCDFHGFCRDGCKDGFHGGMCERTCDTNCMKCNQTSGECLVCKTNWDTDRHSCSDTELEYHEDLGESLDAGENGIPKLVIILPVSALVLILIVVTVAVIIYRKKRLRHRDETTLTSSQSSLQYREIPNQRQNMDVL